MRGIGRPSRRERAVLSFPGSRVRGTGSTMRKSAISHMPNGMSVLS